MREHTAALTYTQKKALRNQEIRRKKNILYSIAIVMIILLIIFISIKISSTPNKAEASISGEYIYESILVKEGDSIWSIAKTHANDYTGSMKNYVNEIIRLNQLNDTNLKAGNQLIIPIHIH